MGGAIRHRRNRGVHLPHGAGGLLQALALVVRALAGLLDLGREFLRGRTHRLRDVLKLIGRVYKQLPLGTLELRQVDDVFHDRALAEGDGGVLNLDPDVRARLGHGLGHLPAPALEGLVAGAGTVSDALQADFSLEVLPRALTSEHAALSAAGGALVQEAYGAVLVADHNGGGQGIKQRDDVAGHFVQTLRQGLVVPLKAVRFELRAQAPGCNLVRRLLDVGDHAGNHARHAVQGL